MYVYVCMDMLPVTCNLISLGTSIKFFRTYEHMYTILIYYKLQLFVIIH